MRLAFALLPLLATPALADAVTYRGTVGDRIAIVELTEPQDGAVAGRFAFLDQGMSIPLNAQSSTHSTFVLSEEGRCTAETCSFDEEAEAISVPSVATWELELDGTTLTGTRQGTGKSKLQQVNLQSIGRRPLEGAPSPMLLRDTAAEILFDQAGSDTVFSPFDAALLEVPPLEHSRLTVGDAAVAMVYDPRTRFPFPRVAAFTDGADTAAVNAILHRAHGQLSLAALDCLSTGYIGFGANGYSYDIGGALGDYEYESVDLSFASPRLVSWTEAGSIYCGGAHPYNHFNSYTYDVQTGEPLDLSRIFTGWVAREYGAEDDTRADLEAARSDPDAYYWFPDDTLVAFVRDNIPPEYLADDSEYEIGCYDELSIRENLDIRFAPGPSVVFTGSGYPHVSSVCNGDYFTLPLAEVQHLLTPEAMSYFPEG